MKKVFLLALCLWLLLVSPLQAQEPTTTFLPIISKGGDDCMGIAKLAISDGTDEINLLNLNGIHLREDTGWTPRIIGAKSGGVWQDSSIASGRRQVFRKFGTAREPLTLDIMGLTEDELIASTAELLQMLEKAVNYWVTSWQDTPVYLIAQSDCETFERYALILDYAMPDLQNPYAQPFIQIADDGAIFDDINLTIERDHWLDNPPGEGDCVEVSSVEEWEYNAKWIASTTLPVFVVRSIFQTSTGRILAGEDVNIWYSDDDGLNWAFLAAVATPPVWRFMQSTTGRIFSGESGQIRYSDNNGAAWGIATVAPVGEVYSLLQTTTGRILAGENGTIWYSDNDGLNWFSATTLPTNYIRSLLQTNTGRILAGDTARIWYSDDDGTTWASLSAVFNNSVYSLLQTTTGRILAGEFEQLWASDNNGNTWYPLLLATGCGFIQDLLQLVNGKILLGESTQIRYSADDGLSWDLATTIPTQTPYFLQSTTEKIFATDGGQVLECDTTTIDMGAAATCVDIVYIANKQNVANLTHIFTGNNAAPHAYNAGNLLPMTAFPVPLFAHVGGGALVVGDSAYFVIDNTIVDSSLFNSLVFDIATPASSTTSYTIVWEYPTAVGAGPGFAITWTALTVTDNTQQFSQVGVNSVHWPQTQTIPWIEITAATGTTINGINGWVVRARISALVGTFSVPTQQNRNVYSAVNGYTEIAEDEIGGDIAALAQILAHNRSDKDGPGGVAPNLYENRLIVGLRSYDRGPDFQAYLNIADEQNPFGITVTAGTNTTIGADIAAPTGRSATYNPAGVEAMATRATIALGPIIARDYYGTYHAFLRVQQTGGAATDFYVRLQIVNGSGGIDWATDTVQVQTTTAFEVLDFGQIKIPVAGSLGLDELGDTTEIRVQASAANAAVNLILYDLILLPTDEWSIDSNDKENSAYSEIGKSSGYEKLLNIDSITKPKYPIRSIVQRVGSELKTSIYNSITPGEAVLQSKAQQRLWFFAMKTSATGAAYSWISPPEIAHSLQLYRTQRYLGLRGNQ